MANGTPNESRMSPPPWARTPSGYLQAPATCGAREFIERFRRPHIRKTGYESFVGFEFLERFPFRATRRTRARAGCSTAARLQLNGTAARFRRTHLVVDAVLADNVNCPLGGGSAHLPRPHRGRSRFQVSSHKGKLQW